MLRKCFAVLWAGFLLLYSSGVGYTQVVEGRIGLEGIS